MTHYIKTESGTTLRNKLLKSIAITIRDLGKQSSVDSDTQDMIAFIVLSLRKISETVEQAIVAWEKRDYWLKADHFRLDWEWSNKSANDLYQALVANDWKKISTLISVIAIKCRNIELTSRFRSSKIWAGAYNNLFGANKKGAA